MPLLGEIAALVTAFLWSGTSIVFAEASIRVGPMYVNVARMFFAIILLSFTLLIFGVPVNISAAQLFNLIISGFIGLAIGDTFLFKAYRLIGARISMLVMSIAPAIAALLAYLFLNENLSLLGIIGIIVTISGVALVVLNRKEIPTSDYKIDYTGLFYAFMGAVGQGVGLIFAKLAFNENEINPFTATITRVLSALIIIYPLVKMTKRFNNPVKIFKENKKGLILTLIGSIIGPYLGITFSLIAISNTKVGIASTIMAMPPIIMLPMVKYFYKEKLSLFSIVGAFIAVGGVAMLFLR